MSFSVASFSFVESKSVLQTGLDAIKKGQYIFDLKNIITADSSCIAVMLAWQRAAAATSKRIQFINPPLNILTLADLYGVADLLGLQNQK